jgi:two-component system cell cycle sensor histidine kinase/response regulator CckA
MPWISKEMFMLHVQDPTVTPYVSQFNCLDCQKTEVLQQQVRGVIHDFNNILQVIIVCSERLLTRAQEEQPLRIDIAEIRKAADQGVSLTRNLLRAHRDQALEPETLDINKLLHDLQHFLRQLIGDRVELRIVFGAGLYPVRMNTSQAQQVITNLLTNARDAMPRGGTLVIESAALELHEYHSEFQLGIPAGRYTTVAVIDTGEGMDAETRSHIFEPFFTTKQSGEGTGLGLATVNGILKQNGAYASVESKLGSGTTFKIFLPAAEGTRPRELPSTTEIFRPVSARLANHMGRI